MAENTKIFGKVYTYTFTAEQLKKILVDLLILSGESIPQDVHEKLNPDAYAEFEADVDLECETKTEVFMDFNIALKFTDAELSGFIKTYQEQRAALTSEPAPEAETDDDLPDNVWTQNSKIPCGKK
jgi:hypothetical protein